MSNFTYIFQGYFTGGNQRPIISSESTMKNMGKSIISLPLSFWYKHNKIQYDETVCIPILCDMKPHFDFDSYSCTVCHTMLISPDSLVDNFMWELSDLVGMFHKKQLIVRLTTLLSL